LYLPLIELFFLTLFLIFPQLGYNFFFFSSYFLFLTFLFLGFFVSFLTLFLLFFQKPLMSLLPLLLFFLLLLLSHLPFMVNRTVFFLFLRLLLLISPRGLSSKVDSLFFLWLWCLSLWLCFLNSLMNLFLKTRWRELKTVDSYENSNSCSNENEINYHMIIWTKEYKSKLGRRI
jgi:hypothetical protein